MGELVVGTAPQRLFTPALGSCVCVALYDPWAKRGGIAHVMLPTYIAPGGDVMGRFADFAVPELAKMLAKVGSPRRRLEAKIAGGAAMFSGDLPMAGVGERNIEAVRSQLELMKVPLVAEDTGEAHARTVELVLESGDLLVRSYQFGTLRL